jgi:hypothetical protein
MIFTAQHHTYNTIMITEGEEGVSQQQQQSFYAGDFNAG